MDLDQTKEEKIEKINKEANVIVVAYLCDIKQYSNDDNLYNEVKDYYIKVYEMDEESVNQEVEKYMNSLKKNENLAKEKHIKIEEKSKIEDDIENEGNENNNLDENDFFSKQRSNSTPINIKQINNLSKGKDKLKETEIKDSDENIEEENKVTKNIEIINKNTIENNENKNQIINNNINIYKIEAKEVIIVENISKNTIDIKQIKSLKKDNNDKPMDNNNITPEQSEKNESNNSQNKIEKK